MNAVANELAAIEREASERAGLGDFGDPGYRAVLQAWAADLLAPELSELGRAFLRRLAVSALMRRLRVIGCLRAHPQITDVRLPRVIMISGLPRTGTTLAHNLLALAPDARALLRWELMEPVPPPESASYAHDPRIAKVQRAIDPLRGSLLERMHWVNADEPEECAWAYLDATSMLGRGCAAAMPRWRQAVMAADPRATFREYRALVQLLLWRNPLPENGVLVLKCPQIADSLAAFAEVFPEAGFVLMHRDPFRALLSASTMLQSINQPFVNGELGVRREQSDWIARHQAGALAAMVAFADAPGRRIAHLHYPDLLDDGPGVCRKALHELGVAVDQAYDARARAFLAAQSGGGRAAPPEAYDDFGYDHDAVLNAPEVADYCRRFAVQPERVRRTGS
ncbi:MAG TPA: sulfotransferase [Polyangiales bacterium]|nr:sulfotransferase [Polyangiales bacterium]